MHLHNIDIKRVIYYLKLYNKWKFVFVDSVKLNIIFVSHLYGMNRYL